MYSTEERVAALRPTIRDFRSWVLGRYGLPPPAPWAVRGTPGKTLTLTLVDRGRAAKRQLADQAAVAAAARAQGFAVAVVDFEPLAFREQLEVLRTTDVLLGVHGGALPLVMFLPRGAVCPWMQHRVVMEVLGRCRQCSNVVLSECLPTLLRCSLDAAQLPIYVIDD